MAVREKPALMLSIAFLCNASSPIGGGHVMRCLALAEELAGGGATVRFAVNQDAPHVVPSLERAGFSLTTGRTLIEAARIAGRQGRVNAVICDSYKINAKFERSMRKLAAKVVAIDDLANRRHDCDLLIDANYGHTAEDYRGLVPSGATVCAGAHYAFLRQEFAALRETSLARRATVGGVDRILVSLGLTDVGGVTARVVAALLSTQLKARIDVVVGPAAQCRIALAEMTLRDSRLALHVDPADMAHLMTNADIAIGAGGTSSWERCCLGLPTVLAVLADNQRKIAEKLGEAGAVGLALGVGEDLVAEITQKVMELSNDASARRRMSGAAAMIVDGRGATRAAEAIYTLIKRDAHADDRQCA
ncbi:MAG: UDP-2,4-diacetamido-2,4,6-trideoxy-beta-L-altropyranose hydrolase [Methylocella sp.]